MRVLQLTCHYQPNVGGVETHLSDLVSGLVIRNYKVFVLTYRPITTKVNWRIYEKNGNVEILRIPWIPGLFYKLVPYPILEFIYLFPGLFVFAPFVILNKKVDVIHAHGLIAGTVAYLWGKLFGKRIVISTHSLYHFSDEGLYRHLSRAIFKGADTVLTLSNGSAKEIEKLGVEKNKIQVFTYWIDLKNFKIIANAKTKIGWKNNFVILFVGRLVEEKGITPLVDAAKIWNKKITLAFAGTGPLEDKIRELSNKYRNIKYLGKINNENLPIYYSAADMLIVPSTHEEGFGRVILESLACGTPVIGSKRGAIPEAMDNSVGKLIDVSPENIKETVEYFYYNPIKLKKLSVNTRDFAVKRYSENNIDKIIKSYQF